MVRLEVMMEWKCQSIDQRSNIQITDVLSKVRNNSRNINVHEVVVHFLV